MLLLTLAAPMLLLEYSPLAATCRRVIRHIPQLVEQSDALSVSVIACYRVTAPLGYYHTAVQLYGCVVNCKTTA